jgi:hypothetical protein
VWIATVGAVYLVAQVLGAPQLGGWVGFAGFLVGYWFGGTRAGLRGRQEWTQFVVILSVIAFFVFGAGSCVYAMALYG